MAKFFFRPTTNNDSLIAKRKQPACQNVFYTDNFRRRFSSWLFAKRRFPLTNSALFSVRSTPPAWATKPQDSSLKKDKWKQTTSPHVCRSRSRELRRRPPAEWAVLFAAPLFESFLFWHSWLCFGCWFPIGAGADWGGPKLV